MERKRRIQTTNQTLQGHTVHSKAAFLLRLRHHLRIVRAVDVGVYMLPSVWQRLTEKIYLFIYSV